MRNFDQRGMFLGRLRISVDDIERAWLSEEAWEMKGSGQ